MKEITITLNEREVESVAALINVEISDLGAIKKKYTGEDRAEIVEEIYVLSNILEKLK